jgi:hypothetical protein
MASTTIYHTQRGFGLCHAPNYSEVGAGLTHPEYGRLVSCWVCGRLGVIPDAGHELEFMPPGTERAPGGGFLLRPA